MLLLGTLVLVATYAADAAGRDVASSWTACQRTVCDRVVDEANGLARVKLLRGYVTETVKLLDSLMVSLDHELVDIATDMKTFVGPRCAQAHAALAQVRKPMLGDELDLSAGIMEESTAQALERSDDLSANDLSFGVETSTTNKNGWGSSTYSNSNSYQYGGQRLTGAGSGRQISQSSAEDDTDDNYDVASTGQSSYSSRKGATATTSRRTDDYSSSNRHQNSREDDSSYSASNRNEHNQTGGRGLFGSHRNRKQQQNWRDGRGSSTASSGDYNSSPRYDSSSSSSRPGSTIGSSSWSPVPTGPTCMGLPNSPYAVPGIDNWCVENCSRGYCPATHCICN